MSSNTNDFRPNPLDDTWSLTDRYPVVDQLFGSDHPSTDVIFEECIVVIDANILISAWESAEDTNPVVKLVNELYKIGKLVTPAQVAREYFFKKNQKVVALRQNVGTALAEIAPSFQLSRLQKILEGDQRLIKLENAIKEIEPVRKRLKEAAQEIQNALTETNAGFGHLPSNLHSSLKASLYDPCWSEQEKNEIKEQAEHRKIRKIPPAFNDDRFGDYIIWQTILRYCSNQNKNCIFVTKDLKSDWVIPGLKDIVVPQPELTQEFFQKTNGKYFAICSLAEALSLIGANQETVAAVREADRLQRMRDELMGREQRLLEVANRLYGIAENAESYATGINSYHPGRGPLNGETMEQFQARSDRFYKVELPTLKAHAEADAAAAWEASTAAVHDYNNAFMERLKFEEVYGEATIAQE